MKNFCTQCQNEYECKNVKSTFCSKRCWREYQKLDPKWVDEEIARATRNIKKRRQEAKKQWKKLVDLTLEEQNRFREVLEQRRNGTNSTTKN